MLKVDLAGPQGWMALLFLELGSEFAVTHLVGSAITHAPASPGLVLSHDSFARRSEATSNVFYSPRLLDCVTEVATDTQTRNSITGIKEMINSYIIPKYERGPVFAMRPSAGAITKTQAIIVALVIVVAGIAGLTVVPYQIRPAPAPQQPAQVPQPGQAPPQPLMDPRLELAKQEAGLLIYTSVDAEDFAPIHSAFEAKYPELKGKVQYLRIGPREIVTRIVSETQSGKPTADMVVMSYTNAHELQRDKFFKPYKSKELSGFKSSLYDQNGEWAAAILLPAGFAYNTKLVKKDEVPKTLEEIASAKWKGKAEIHSLALGTVGTQYVATLRGIVGETKYKAFIDGLLTNVQPKPNVALHGVAQDLANGEISLGIIIFLHEITKLKEQGYPVEFFLPSDAPLLVTTSVAAIIKTVKSPNLAEIFEDYLLSQEGQKVIGSISVRIPARSGLTDVKYSVEKLVPGAELILFPSADVAAKSKQMAEEFKKMGFGEG